MIKIKENKEMIKYTLRHKKAFLNIEKNLLRKNTIRGYLHDIDKVFLYMFMNYKDAHNFHRNHSRHHSIKAKTEKDFIQMVIDWECARYTKPDKPLNARETLYKYYPDLSDKVEPILKKFNL